MPKNVTYISDFFVDHILGGGELNDHELIKLLSSENSISSSKHRIFTKQF